LIAADDVAVARFLDGTLDFQAIAGLCQDAVERFAGQGSPEPGLEELIDLDREVREWAATATPVRTSGTTHA
jgi:1-deoxy-D-xylulose 5-phosphate reductoisomerase